MSFSCDDQVEHNDTARLPTESEEWVCLDKLRAYLSSRLAGSRRSRGRPEKRENDAALFEVDLRNIFDKAPLTDGLSSEDHANMSQVAAELLVVLDELVNEQLIDSEEERQSAGWEPKSHEEPYEARLLRDNQYPRLSALMVFLADVDGMLDLATGPHPIFSPSVGNNWDLASQRVAAWKGFLQRTTASGKSSGQQLLSLSMSHTQTPTEWTQTPPDMPGKRASVLVGAMFREFRRLNCGNGRKHEIKLKVPGDMYTSQRSLDLFVSSCVTSSEGHGEWQEWPRAEGGEILELFTGDIEDSVCSAINRARSQGRSLQLSVGNDQKLLVFSTSVSTEQPAQLTFMSLSELLRSQTFHTPHFMDLYRGTADADKKFGSRTKAALALSLARCLMDFIDEQLELAMYSWKPEHIFLLYPKGGDVRHGTLCISLKESPKAPAVDLIGSICPGNPVLLSFARLLLEIHGGNELDIDIHPDDVGHNAGIWGRMCFALEQAKKNGDGHFLQAVQGCLYLHFSQPGEDEGATGPAAASIVRQRMYKSIVRNLELTVEPAISGVIRQRASLEDMSYASPFMETSVPQRPQSTPSGASRIVSHRGRAGRTLTTRTHRTSGGSATEVPVDENTLYDADEKEDDEGSETARLALEYRGFINKANNQFLHPLCGRPTAAGKERPQRPIRVAIIDSGINMSDPLIKRNTQRIKEKRNWTDNDCENWTDTFGHGTHVARLLLEVAHAAEIYIARVSVAKNISKPVLIAQAIRCASEDWDVDIISLSLGLSKKHPEIDKELNKVLEPKSADDRKRIVIAAAANWAGNSKTAYPARLQKVISISATDGGGNPWKMNPTAKERSYNFALLGQSIESWRRPKDTVSFKPAMEGLWGNDGAVKDMIKPRPKVEKVWISGTSYATPIAAGIAANVLEFARQHVQMTPGEVETLYSGFGMRRMFQAMSGKRGDFDYITPWSLFASDLSEGTIAECIKRILDDPEASPRDILEEMQ